MRYAKPHHFAINQSREHLRSQRTFFFVAGDTPGSYSKPYASYIEAVNAKEGLTGSWQGEGTILEVQGADLADARRRALMVHKGWLDMAPNQSAPKVYLSASDGKYRVISQGIPISPDKRTAAEALEAATRFKLRVADQMWDGDAGAWRPLHALVPNAHSSWERYWTVLIPYSEERRTKWHPTERFGPFAVLSRGAFPTPEEAHAWAAAHLEGQPYTLREIDNREVFAAEAEASALIGAQVTLFWEGRELLGDVKGVREEDGHLRLRVSHFNGEPWPVEPLASEVDVLERTYDELEPNARARASADSGAAEDLVLFIENTAELVGDPSQGWSIVLNLLRKWRKGTYDHAQAPKLWGYLVESGAKLYVKEMQPGVSWNVMFNPATRELAAQTLADQFLATVRSGEYDHVDTKIRR